MSTWWKKARSRGVLKVLAAGGTVVLLLLALVVPGRPTEDHNIELEPICYDCHSLATGGSTGSDPNTSLINAASRNLPLIRNQWGSNTAPPVFPCNYCHNDYTRTDKMFGSSLLDFQSGTQTSSHFIGKTFAGIPGTLGELESNWNGDSFNGNLTILKNTNELQCVTCHDPGIIPDDYPNHPNSTLFLTPNPYRLRGLGGVGDDASIWTPLCVGTCHVGTTLDNNTPINPADDIAVPPMGHYGYAGYDGTTMFTPRGSALRTSNCATCHDPHSSSKANLISDGTALPPGTPLASRGGTAKKPAITESNCTLVCHIVPPNYSTAGHGKYGHSTTACTPCHTSAVSHRDSANPKRFAFDEDAIPSNLPNNGLGGGSGDGLDNDYNGVLDEAGESDWRYSQESICRGCHYSYRSHSGNVNVGTEPLVHLGMAGCLDCHEPHANGIGSGPANTRMLRRTTFGETSIFANSAPPTADFYRADGNGLCDNENCHGKPLGTIALTGTIMGDVPDHRNENIVPGNKCTSCHTHQGAASFTSDCDTCHGNPPNDVDTSPDNPDGVGVHALHVGTYNYGCNECHFRDATANNYHNESGWATNQGLISRFLVDVVFNTHGGTVNQSAAYSDYVGGQMTSSAHTCNNVTCHNPDGGTAGNPGITGKTTSAGYTPKAPQWRDSITPINQCTGCHVVSPAGNPDGGSHYLHDNIAAPAAKGYACTTCHGDVNITGGATRTTHAKLTLDTTGIVHFNGSIGTQNLGIGTYDTPTANTCYNIYCHGGTLPAGGSSTTPVWGTTGSGACGACHDNDLTDTTNTTYIDSGSHTTHLDGTLALNGPKAACTNCHAYTTGAATHINGSANFTNTGIATGSIRTDTAVTSCDTCHAGAAAQAKNQWPFASGNWLSNSGTYPVEERYCEHCHDITPSVVSTLAGTSNIPMTAPQVMGDETTAISTYGPNVTGHGLPSAENYASGNVGAEKSCVKCHTTSSAHINSTAGTTFTDHRLVGTLNTPPVTPITTIEGICNACHQNAGTELGTQASRHGNGTGAIEGAFVQNCTVCHDVHGSKVFNGVSVNASMIRASLAAPDGTRNVAFTARTGANSFDESAGDATTANNLDDLCATCHIDAAGAGTTLVKNNVVPAGGGVHANSTIYLGDERDRNCIPCHKHDYDNVAATNDGFRAKGCNDCHTYPGLPTVAGTHALTTIHDEHVGRASDQPVVNNKGYLCVTCHYGYTHNESNRYSGVGWDDFTVLPASINIRFDAAWNPGSPTYNGLNASTLTAPGKAGTHDGACAATYCHGATISAGGLYTAPIWSLAPPVNCDSCHLFTKATLTSRSHQAHLATSTAAAGSAIDCTSCHTAYNLAAGGTHVDGSVTFTGFAYSGNAGDKDPLTALGSCGVNLCHNDGQSAAAISTYTWGTPLGVTNSCTECHNALTNTLVSNSHGAHLTSSTGAGAVCGNCHATATVNTHGNGSVTFSGAFTYAPAAAIPVAAAGGTFGTCGINTCHNNGQLSVADSEYTWNTVLGGGTNSCTECHGATSASMTTQSHPKHNAVPNCAQCHAAATLNSHANGSINLPGTLAVVYSGGNTVVAAGGGTFGTCTGPATGCHMGSVTPTWGGTTNCSSCHGYPPTAGTSHLDANRTGYTNNDTTFLAAHSQCSICHGVSGNTTYPTAPTGFGTPVDKTPTGDVYVVGTMHGDGSVQMNGAGGANTPYTENTNYNATTWACDSAGCHTSSVKFVNSTSSIPVEMREFGSGACESCHNGTVSLAPNVMTYWSGSVGGQDGGHGDATPLACTACHDISLPASPASAQHGTGTYNSIWANDSTRSTNTSHLKAEFFTKYPANGAGDWSVQVAFDQYCNWECHDINRDDVWDLTEVASFMWHSQVHPELGETTSDFNYRSVEFGTHLTIDPASADALADIPIDIDLNTNASGAYAPCISCHDPHGTGTVKPVTKSSNRMLRFTWPPTNNILCSKCHI